MHILSHKCRIYPSKRQNKRFEMILSVCQDYYNALLTQYKKDFQNNKIPTNLLEYFKKITNHYKKVKYSMKYLETSTINDVIKNVIKAINSSYNPENIKLKNQQRKTNSFLLNNNSNISLTNNKLHLPEYGTIKLHYGKTFDIDNIISYRVLQQNKKWFIIITTKLLDNKPLPKTGKVIGADLGIKNVIILSNGEKYDFPDISDLNNKLSKLNSELSKKQTGSIKYNNLIIKINNLHAHRKNIIINYYHQLSIELVKKYDVIAMENLDIRDMIKDPNFSKNIFNANWHKLVEMIKYKCEIYGKTFIQVDTYFPSSKLCNKCGYKHNLTIDERMWECPKCGYIHDRDVNAAKNILNQALKTLN